MQIDAWCENQEEIFRAKYLNLEARSQFDLTPDNGQIHVS